MTIITSPPPLDEATMLASSGFVKPVSDELYEDVRQHMESGDLVFGLMVEDRYIGFVIFCLWDDVLYLSGIILHEDYQGHASLGDIVEHVRERYDVRYFALRTQSPRMWSAANKVCSRWFPESGVDSVDPDLEKVGRIVAEKIGSEFPFHRGCYGGPLYGEKPLHRREELQHWWDSVCDFAAGDAVICVGELS